MQTEVAPKTLESIFLQSERRLPSAAGFTSASSAELSDPAESSSVPITIAFFSAPVFTVRLIALTITPTVLTNGPSVAEEPVQSSAANTDLTTSANTAARPFVVTSTEAAAGNTAVIRAVVPVLNDAAARFLAAVGTAFQPGRAYQISGDSTVVATGHGFGPLLRFGDPTIATIPVPFLRLPPGGGDQPPATTEAAPLVPGKPATPSGGNQEQNGVVADAAEKPAVWTAWWSRLAVGTLTGATMLYLLLSGYGSGLARKVRNRRRGLILKN